MGAANPGSGIGRDRRCTWHGAYGGAASAGIEMRSGGAQVLQSEPDQRAEARSNHCQRHNREAASNARTPEPGSDAATPGRGDPLEVSRRIRGAEPGAAGNSARLDRERASVFGAYNSGSCLLVNRPPLGAQSEGGGIDSHWGGVVERGRNFGRTTREGVAGGRSALPQRGLEEDA